MYAEERQQAIAALVAQRGAPVRGRARRAKFDVTTETVRRDLSALDRAGLVRRVHGGAVPASALRVLEQAVTDRDRANAEEKDRIAAAALRWVPERGCVLVRRRHHHRPAAPACSPSTTASTWSPTRSRSRPGSPATRHRPAAAAGTCPSDHAGRRR